MDVERGCPYRRIMDDERNLNCISLGFISRRVKDTHNNGEAFCRWLGYFHRKKTELLIQELRGEPHEY